MQLKREFTRQKDTINCMKLKYVKTTGVRKPETKGNYD